MITKITGITLHKTPIGDRMSITYGLISENGTVVAQNKRAEFVLNDSELNIVQDVYDLANSKILESSM